MLSRDRPGKRKYALAMAISSGMFNVTLNSHMENAHGH